MNRDDSSGAQRGSLRRLDALYQPFRNARGTTKSLASLLKVFQSAVLAAVPLSQQRENSELKDLFSSEADAQQRRFIAIALLRLLATNEDCFNEQSELRFKALHLFDDTLPDLYRALSIDENTQNFAKERALIEAVKTAETRIRDSLNGFQTLAILPQFRQAFTRALNDKLARAIITPFLPRELIELRLVEMFVIVEEYVAETGPDALVALQKARAAIHDYAEDAGAFDTRYSREFLCTFAAHMQHRIDEDFSERPLSKPAQLHVQCLDKKYPLSVLGSSFQLSLRVLNAGPGHAFSVSLNIDENECALFGQKETFLGHLAPGAQVVDFGIRCEVSCTSLPITGSIRWSNVSGENESLPFTIVLQAQKGGVQWDALRTEDPYALEPVDAENDLVGRKEILDQLARLIEAKSIGSAIVFGQKRVGKTSVVKTLKTRIEGSRAGKCMVIYLEGGDYVSPDPKETVATLGRMICEEIQSSDRKFAGIPVPPFADALSPLVGFLNSVTRVDSDFRVVIILDEFDELPLDLYRRGAIGDALFLTLRSISGKPSFGFILVGGEKMPFIINYQGDRLNKFQPVRVDYFDKEKHWTDFQDLVRRPISQWIDVSDGAVVSLYQETSGNPFFTKLICREIFSMAVERRDSHVTEKEVEKAVVAALKNVSSTMFQHFWSDGLLETGDRLEEKSILRRRILLAMADTIRNNERTIRENIVRHALEQDVGKLYVEEELREFERRQVLVQHEDYTCKIPLFQKWLVEFGVGEIMTSIPDAGAYLARRREEEELRVKPGEITELVRRWSTYRGRPISDEQVRHWLNQFGPDPVNQRLMFQILEGIRFYGPERIREKLREAHGIVLRDVKTTIQQQKKKTASIIVSYVDAVGKSGAHYASLYADENDIYASNVVEQGKLQRTLKESEDVQALVFVDDLLGTGKSATANLKALLFQLEATIAEREIPVVLIALAGFAKAKDYVVDGLASANVPVRIHVCDPLGDAERAFSEQSCTFKDAVQREKAKTIAFQMGSALEKKHPLGYGGCEATIVFDSSCPNNSLPILWAKSRTWNPLFERL